MDLLSVHTCITSASSFVMPVGITKGGVVLAQASAFLCLFMRLMIACCSRACSGPFVTLAIAGCFGIRLCSGHTLGATVTVLSCFYQVDGAISP